MVEEKGEVSEVSEARLVVDDVWIAEDSLGREPECPRAKRAVLAGQPAPTPKQ